MTTAPHKNSDMASTAFRSDLIGFGDIKSHAIKGWEEYMHEGEQYLSTARNAFAGQRHAFTAEILYNVIAMAIEKLVMGALMQSGNLPYNHTMRDLAEAMEEHFPGRLGGIKDRLISLDAYQEICDLDTYHRQPPTMEEIPAMLSLAIELQELVSR
ncbi:MAG: hypothetical protein M0P70_10230 [Desulfobulbaceae bacterium]|nr:hypothetical protein [Desulfobulbaceae bacterium]